MLYGNGFGAVSSPVVRGAGSQSGSLTPMPAIQIGGANADVAFAGLVSPGLFQFNVTVPPNTPDGNQLVTATSNGLTTQAGTVIAVQH